jgi:hypothetical protein
VSQRRRDENAQGLIEFAILASVALLIFLGTVDFGRFLYYDNAIRSATRVGAEVASQHCPFRAGTCAVSGSAVTSDYVLWATSCEAAGNVRLTPFYSPCTPGTTSTWTPASTCVGTCSNCVNDICVSSAVVAPDTHAQVTVNVGMNFRPINPVMSAFFQDQSCFSGDDTTVNHHTLCAQSVGRVF